MVNYGRARNKGSMINRKENNRNQKRAGCVSSVGRPVNIAASKRCCCDSNTVWCLVNKKTVLLSKKSCEANKGTRVNK